MKIIAFSFVSIFYSVSKLFGKLSCTLSNSNKLHCQIFMEFQIFFPMLWEILVHLKPCYWAFEPSFWTQFLDWFCVTAIHYTQCKQSMKKNMTRLRDGKSGRCPEEKNHYAYLHVAWTKQPFIDQSNDCNFSGATLKGYL